jgi:hypothetical protein
MTCPVERFLAALREHGFKPRRSGNGWACQCPAHDDRTPSLSITKGDGGHALVHCHAGCDTKAVCAAVDFPFPDLFADDPTRRSVTPGPRRRGDGDETKPKPARDRGFVAVAKPERVFATGREAVAELERRFGSRSALWTYYNAGGEPVGVVFRRDRDEGGKTVRHAWRTADGAGWVLEGGPKPHPLYGLPDLLKMPKGSRVWVCEGEKATDAARAIGLAATTSAGGAERAKGSDWSPVAGHDVVILPDHDDAGEEYAADVVTLANTAGARSVRVVRIADTWPGIGKGDDLADYVEHRRREGAADDVIRGEVESLAADAEPERSEPNAAARLAFAPFPVHVLPEPVRGFVVEGARAIGCDTSFVALPVLAALAAAIGNTRRLMLKRGWTEPPIVWAAIVGESGTTKSPAIELALGAIRKRQRDAMKRHAEAMKRHDAAELIYKRALAKWNTAKSDDPPAKPVPPVASRYWTDDATTEALAVLLQQNPRGLLLARDELAGWLGSFDRYASGKGGDVAKWLEMFGGRPIMVDRKMGGVLNVPSAAVSVVGGIQPETLRRVLGQEHRDNGLAARLLLAWPPRRAKRWTEVEVDANTEAAVAAVFERLFALTPVPDDAGEDRPGLVSLDADAKAAWVAFFDRHNQAQADLSGDESAAWSKLEGYAARLALVVHLTRCAANDDTIRGPARVDATSVAAGVGLVRWFGAEARRVYAMLAESDDDRATRRLVEWIEGKGGTVTVRDLTRGPREYRGDTEAAGEALRGLVAAGVGRFDHDGQGPGGGRPTDRFRLLSRPGDTGDGDETPVNAGSRVGFVAVAAPSTAKAAEPDDPGDDWGEAPGTALGRRIGGEAAGGS